MLVCAYVCVRVCVLVTNHPHLSHCSTCLRKRGSESYFNVIVGLFCKRALFLYNFFVKLFICITFCLALLPTNRIGKEGIPSFPMRFFGKRASQNVIHMKLHFFSLKCATHEAHAPSYTLSPVRSHELASRTSITNVHLNLIRGTPLTYLGCTSEVLGAIYAPRRDWVSRPPARRYAWLCDSGSVCWLSVPLSLFKSLVSLGPSVSTPHLLPTPWQFCNFLRRVQYIAVGFTARLFLSVLTYDTHVVFAPLQ